jgi:hypothetical protein
MLNYIQHVCSSQKQTRQVWVRCASLESARKILFKAVDGQLEWKPIPATMSEHHPNTVVIEFQYFEEAYLLALKEMPGVEDAGLMESEFTHLPQPETLRQQFINAA